MFKELFLFENNMFWQDYTCELYIVKLIENLFSKTVCLTNGLMPAQSTMCIAA